MKLSLAIISLGLVTLAGPAQDFRFVPKGGSQLAGGYVPQNLGLKEARPEGLQGGPSGDGVMYGVIKFGSRTAPTSYAVVLVDKDDGEAVAYVDANADMKITESEKVEWKRNGTAPAATYVGNVTLLWDGRAYSIGFYHFSKSVATQRKLNPHSIFYYRDYASQGELALGKQKYKVLLNDTGVWGDMSMGKVPEQNVQLLFDLNENGKFGEPGEAFAAGAPFNIGGETYVVRNISRDGTVVTAGVSAVKVAAIEPPPSLAAGKPVLKFTTVGTDGNPVNFPGDYKGKVVLLDFWATWCGPCVKEVPNVVATYNRYHDQGFEILGISLDREGDLPKLQKFTADNKMPWRQVFDGKFWQAEVAKKYGIHSIPAMVLVDGDTGLIIASGNDLRGEGLAEHVGTAMKNKK